MKFKKALALFLCAAMVFTLLPAVALAGDEPLYTECGTKDEVVAAIAAGNSVKLTADIDLGAATGSDPSTLQVTSTLSIDLNNFKLYGNPNAPGTVRSTVIEVSNEAVLTITDNSDAKGGTIYNAYTGNSNCFTIKVANASLILEAGNIDVKSTVRSGIGIEFSSGGVGIMNGGTIYGRKIGNYSECGVKMSNGSTFTLNAGTIVCDTSANGIQTDIGAEDAPVVLNIAGGTVSNVGGSASAKYCTYNISGGTIDYLSFPAGCSATMTGTPTLTNVSGVISAQSGMFYGDIGSTANFSVSVLSCLEDSVTYQWQKSTDGGTTFADLTGEIENEYSVEITEELYGTKYRCNITFTDTHANSSVIASNAATLQKFVAEIEGVKYGTILQAIAAAQTGDIITLLCNSDPISTMTINKDITIDFKGKHIQYDKLGNTSTPVTVGSTTPCTVTFKDTGSGGGLILNVAGSIRYPLAVKANSTVVINGGSFINNSTKAASMDINNAGTLKVNCDLSINKLANTGRLENNSTFINNGVVTNNGTIANNGIWADLGGTMTSGTVDPQSVYYRKTPGATAAEDVYELFANGKPIVISTPDADSGDGARVSLMNDSAEVCDIGINAKTKIYGLGAMETYSGASIKMNAGTVGSIHLGDYNGDDSKVTGAAVLDIAARAVVSGDIYVGGGLDEAASITLTAPGKTIKTGWDTANDDLTVKAGATLTVGKVLYTGGLLRGGKALDTDTTLSVGGALTVNGTINVESDGKLAVQSTGEAAVVKGGTLNVSGIAEVATGGTLEIKGTADVKAGSTLDVQGTLAVEGLLNNKGDVKGIVGTIFENDPKFENPSAKSYIVKNSDPAGVPAQYEVKRGETYKAWEAGVQDAPNFTTELANKTYYVGDSIDDLRVDGENFQTVHLDWYKDGVLIDGTNTNVITPDIDTSVPGTYVYKCIALRSSGDCAARSMTSCTIVVSQPVINYSISVSASPAEGGTVTGGGTYSRSTRNTVTAKPADGYKFVCWSENGKEVSTDAAYTFFVTRDRSLVAEFETVQFAVTVNGGTGSGVFAYGAEVKIAADDPADGMIFAKWTVVPDDLELADSTAAQTSFIMPAADVELTAVYEAVKYNVVVTGGEGSGEYAAGETVTISANENKKFKKWIINSGEIELADATAAVTTFVMPKGDVALTAEYVNGEYNVTVEGGLGTGAYKPGDTVEITATALPGKQFVQWNVTAGAIDLADAKSAVTTFVMPEEDVAIEAEHKTIKPVSPKLTGTAVKLGTIQLNWSKVACDFGGYTLMRRAVDEKTWEVLADELMELTYTDTGLAPGTRYIYLVHAENDGVGGFNSNVYIGIPRPAAPTDLVLSKSANGVKITWNSADADNGDVFYRIVRFQPGAAAWRGIKIGVDSCTLTDTTVKSGTTYYYRVHAYTKLPNGKNLFSYFSDKVSIRY